MSVKRCLLCGGDGRVYSFRLDAELACYVCDGTGQDLLGHDYDHDQAPEFQVGW